MKWQQQSNVYKPHRPMMHIMKVMKDIVSMIQKRFEKYDLIIADELDLRDGTRFSEIPPLQVQSLIGLHTKLI